jgi:hypothetical protein
MHKRLRVMAAERGISMASLIREAIEEKTLNGAGKPRPRSKSMGMFDSGFTDTARLSGDMKFEPRSWRS